VAPIKRILSSLFLSFLFVFLVIPTFSFSTTRGIKVTAKEGKSLYLYKDYHAMVVGISEYEKYPKLPNAVNDAKEVASKLKELGFEVKLVLDPTYQEMKTALNDMVYEMGNEESRAILFYYAGHGETEILADGTKMGYIIPRDCPIFKKDPKSFASHSISMRDIESVSLRIQSKHLLMLFDSCFSGSLFNLVRAVPDDITEKSAFPVRQYITAGRQDEQVPDRSMFKRCFLIGLDGDADLTGDGYITGSELGMYLSEKVVNYTQRQQHPQYGKINNPNLDRGDFIFVSLKDRQKEEAAEKKLQEEKIAISEELKRLREEMKKNEAIVEQVKRLLETKASEEKVSKEATEKKALEEEIKRLKTEMDKTSLTIKELQSKKAGEKRLAYIPEDAKRVLDELRSGQGPFKIDDFEDKDQWSIYFNDKWREFSQGQAKLKVSVDSTQGANGTSSSMKIEYTLEKDSSISVQIGGTRTTRISEIEKDRLTAYNLSKFNKIAFYLKGRKSETFFSRPNNILVFIHCYGEDIKSREGKFAAYHNNTIIRPNKEWKKIEIPFDDFVPSARTMRNVANYPQKPDLHNVLNLGFVFSGFKSDGGDLGSNTVWIDEITLE
jgi:uncharacterized caspase-like protein